MGKRHFLPLWISLTGFTALLTTVSVITTVLMKQNSAAVNMFFHTQEFKIVQDEENESEEAKIYFKSSYGDDVDGDIIAEEDRYICVEVEEEGAALLWNNNDALPLDSGNKVSLLSQSSYEIVETGSGSGYLPNFNYSKNLKDSLSDVGITANPTLWDFYAANTGPGKSYRRTTREGNCTENQTLSVNEIPWSNYSTNVLNSFTAYNDAAIIVLSRTGGEYSDLKTHGVDTHDKNYLNLSDSEVNLFRNVVNYKKNGTFNKLILLINSGNPIQLSEIQEFIPDIDAAMYIGQPGTYGCEAVANLLVGDANPSGGLADTWCYDNTVAPACFNDGDYSYNQPTRYTTDKLLNRYMVYQEGIYVGYRYFETRYEDYISEVENVGEFDYQGTVCFPFGYGLSYTEFEYSNFRVEKKDNGFKLSCRVKNVGDVAGKNAVQFYLQKPYTLYDQSNEIEKSSVELCGFVKTKNIKPNEYRDVEYHVDMEQLRTYDFLGKESYIAEAGDYYFTVAGDAHEATNNILMKKGFAKSELLPAGCQEEVIANGALADSVKMERNFADFTKDKNTGVEITNQLNLGDINLYENNGDQHVNYLSRSNWEGTFPKDYERITMTEGMFNDLKYEKTEVLEDDGEYADLPFPTYGAKYEEEDVTAITLKDQPYDSPYWDKLLDKMTWSEQEYLCVNAYHHTQEAVSIGLPGSNQENGPVGITKRSDFPLPGGKDYKYCAYPNGPIMGGTFNEQLIEKMGEHMSEDMLYTKYNGIYGPGANLHRTAFSGRAWEYPGEDQFLTGKICAAEIRGIQTKGCMAFAKHFALNDLETNRRHVSIWTTEQASREVYLNAFQIAFIEGDCRATMNSFTRVGPKWCGACPELITNILRKEWGWKGINITDWMSGGPMNHLDAIMAGTDSFDGNGQIGNLSAWKDSKIFAYRVRESAKRIIYNVLKTNAMNGISSSTRIERVTPWWRKTTIAISWSLAGVTLAFAGLLSFSIYLNIRDKKKKPE